MRKVFLDTVCLIAVCDGDDLITEAWSHYERGLNAEAGVVDQISFLVVRRKGITDALTNDWHFEAAGFRRLF